MPALATQPSLRDKAFASLNQLPPFNPTLNKLLAILAKENVFYAEVASVIEKDTVLAGNVLKLVNSALYARAGSVNSVRNAVALLGTTKLRNLALSMSVSRMFKQMNTAKSWSQAAFNLHSVAAAIMSDSLAQRVDVGYPEGAFTAGLLHAVGKLLLAAGLPDQFEATLALYASSGSMTMEEAEYQITGCCHAELAAAAMGHWKLPLEIQEAVGNQHQPRPATTGPMELSRLLYYAHRVVNRLDVMIPACACQSPGSAEHELAGLGFGDHANQILDEFRSEFDIMRSFF